MRYRKLDANGDYNFGKGAQSFWKDVPDGVAQAVSTRLQLSLGEWMYNVNDGTNWNPGVLGNRTSNHRDTIVRARVSGTTGVDSVTSYSSNFDSNVRNFSVAITLDTIYGRTSLYQAFGNIAVSGSSTRGI